MSRFLRPLALFAVVSSPVIALSAEPLRAPQTGVPQASSSSAPWTLSSTSPSAASEAASSRTTARLSIADAAASTATSQGSAPVAAGATASDAAASTATSQGSAPVAAGATASDAAASPPTSQPAAAAPPGSTASDAPASTQTSQPAPPVALPSTATALAPPPPSGATDQGDSGLPSLPPQASVGGASSAWDRLGLFGYGEISYTRPVDHSDLTRADLARAVFGISYTFDDRTQFNSEFEVEHAVASADDAGEIEVEQFFIDRVLADWASIKAGLFLIPSGLLNLNHEPTRYYGVERNFVETLVIPSTWREGGVALHGQFAFGLGWDVGLITGLNFSGWEFNPEAPLYETASELPEAAPFRQTHQELSLADAERLSQYVALSYKGLPGLNVGASVFTGEVATPTLAEGLPSQRITLWEVHGRYDLGFVDLSALYARGTISDTGAYNLLNAGASNPEPAAFYGGYLQAAVTPWRHGGMRVSPFVRWEKYNLGQSFEGIAPGATPVPTGEAPGGGPWPQPHDQVVTVGANFYLNPHVVVKADYQRFDVNGDLSRVDLGLGLDF